MPRGKGSVVDIGGGRQWSESLRQGERILDKTIE